MRSVYIVVALALALAGCRVAPAPVQREAATVAPPAVNTAVPATTTGVSTTTDRQEQITPPSPRYRGAVLAGTASPLLDFNQADYEQAIASGKVVFLYFYANWCPICRAEFPRMQQAFNELATDAVVGFRVNYRDDQTDDDEVALARQFGVAYQHTKIILKQGDVVLKAPDGWDLERYQKELTTITN